MNFEADILSAMLSNTGITGLVGTRIAWDIADGSWQAPYIVCQTVSEDGDPDLSGDVGVSFPLVQFACWAATRGSATEIGQAVIDGLTKQTLNGDAGCVLTFSNRVSTFDEQARLYGVTIDLRVAINTSN